MDDDALKMMMTWIMMMTLTSLTYSLSQMSVRIVRKLGSMWSISRRKSARRFSQMMMVMMVFIHGDWVVCGVPQRESQWEGISQIMMLLMVMMLVLVTKTARKLLSSSRRKSAKRFSQMMTRMMMVFICPDHINGDERRKRVVIKRIDSNNEKYNIYSIGGRHPRGNTFRGKGSIT